MDTLLDVPESLSPRLLWMKQHGIITLMRKGILNGGPMVQWDASNGAIHAVAETEDDALTDLAKKLNIRLWNEV